MKIGQLSDDQLLKSTKNLVAHEREVLARVLEHLEEIERRRLFASLRYRSLYDYCLKELMYSEAQSYRRISAMRLAKNNQQVKNEIQKGTLTLTNANMLSDLFKQAKLMPAEKEKIISDVTNSSKQECEGKIGEIKKRFGIEPDTKKDIIKKENDQSVRLHISVEQKTVNNLNQLRGMYQHKKGISFGGIIDIATESMVAINLKKRFKSVRAVSVRKDTEVLADRIKHKNRSRHIPIMTKEAVFGQSGGLCSNCGSTFNLEIDHRKPFAKKGSNTTENLRILCKSCNQRAAIKDFGQQHMDKFIN